MKQPSSRVTGLEVAAVEPKAPAEPGEEEDAAPSAWAVHRTPGNLGAQARRENREHRESQRKLGLSVGLLEIAEHRGRREPWACIESMKAGD